jgi:hypothetical protein
MGKRSRKRPEGPVRTAEPVAPRAPARPTTARRPGQSRMDRMLERADERPKPPWHPVPLVEACVLAGIVLLVVGFLNADSSDGRIAIGLGLALASIAGLETAAREHFAGYRSHSTLLAALPAVIVMAVLGIATGIPAVVIAGGGVVFAGGFWLLRRAFRTRTGVGFRV